MVREAGDVQTFLAQHPPFNHLSENQLEYASDNIHVAFSKSGNELRLDATTEGVSAAGMLIVRSGSIEVRDNQGALIDRLSSGDYLVQSVLYADMKNTPRMIVLEDREQQRRMLPVQGFHEIGVVLEAIDDLEHVGLERRTG